MIAHALATGTDPSGEIPMGRMGSITLDETGSAAMADPFTYDSSNIDQFKDIF
jgi:rhamnose transport system substrate-binding protein